MRKQIFSPAVTLAVATHQTVRLPPSLPLRGKVLNKVKRMRADLPQSSGNRL